MRGIGKPKEKSNEMTLVEQVHVKPPNPFFAECDHICFLSKNLYNATLYAVNQYYEETGQHLSYKEVNRRFTHEDQPDYRALPAKVSKHTQMLVEQAFQAYFALLKKKAKGEYESNVNRPRYLKKLKGRQVTHYEKGAISFKEEGHIILSGTSLRIPTTHGKEDIEFARIVPRGTHYVVEIGYKVQLPELSASERVLAIDMGVNNLAACTTTDGEKFIISGRPLKSINQMWNKQTAQHRSRLEKNHGRKSSKLLHNRARKRNARVKDYIHKATKAIVRHAIFVGVGTIVLGYNAGWKQGTTLDKKNNQNFVQIPFDLFRKTLAYKCALAGIRFVTTKESYTSKNSFVDGEYPRKRETYAGRRVKRGLFKTKEGLKINADINASFNIMRKFMEKEETWNSCLQENLVGACSAPSVLRLSFAA